MVGEEWIRTIEAPKSTYFTGKTLAGLRHFDLLYTRPYEFGLGVAAPKPVVVLR